MGGGRIPWCKFMLMPEADLLAYFRRLYEEQGFAAFSFKALNRHEGPYTSLYRRGLAVKVWVSDAPPVFDAAVGCSRRCHATRCLGTTAPARPGRLGSSFPTGLAGEGASVYIGRRAMIDAVHHHRNAIRQALQVLCAPACVGQWLEGPLALAGLLLLGRPTRWKSE
jgi:hypothetical protein